MYDINEAFQKLNLLDEAVFDSNDDSEMEDLGTLMKTDYEMADDVVDVIDPNAETETDILDSYVDKIIVVCPVCNREIFKDKEDLEPNEDGTLVNIEEECPYCSTVGGFKLEGIVQPFTAQDLQVSINGEDVDVEEDTEEDTEEEITEACGKRQKHCNEDIDENCKEITIEDGEDEKKSFTESLRRAIKKKKSFTESLREAIEDVSVKTGDQELEMTNDPETQELSVKTRPRQPEAGIEGIGEIPDDDFSDIMANGEDFESEDEFNPDDLEAEADFGSDEFGEDELAEEPLEGEDEEYVPAEDEDFADIDEVEEEDINDVVESYLRGVYENVNSFKMTKATKRNDKLVIEGLIRYSNGNTGTTSFELGLAEAKKNGKVTFIGENTHITGGKKAFTFSGKINNGNFICESLRYHYRTKDTDGISRRLYNTVYSGR